MIGDRDSAPGPYPAPVSCGGVSSGGAPPGALAVVPALDESARIAQTVRALLGAPGVDAVVVVDDGSTDDTSGLARAAGATVVRHDRPRGKAAALTSGVLALPDDDRPVLFLDADLAESAHSAGALVRPVLDGEADMTIATLPPQVRADGTAAGGLGTVVAVSRAGIARATGFSAAQPLSGQRCLTRAALGAALPLARGFGVETAMTVDVLRAGLRVVEVPVPFAHRATGDDLAGRLHRALQLADVTAALGRSSLPRPVATAVDLTSRLAGRGLRAASRRLAHSR